MHMLHVFEARPNFMKAAPVLSALAEHNIRQILVHTCKHDGAQMSDVFFAEPGTPEPDVYNLGAQSFVPT